MQSLFNPCEATENQKQTQHIVALDTVFIVMIHRHLHFQVASSIWCCLYLSLPRKLDSLCESFWNWICLGLLMWLSISGNFVCVFVCALCVRACAQTHKCEHDRVCTLTSVCSVLARCSLAVSDSLSTSMCCLQSEFWLVSVSSLVCRACISDSFLFSSCFSCSIWRSHTHTHTQICYEKL